VQGCAFWGLDNKILYFNPFLPPPKKPEILGQFFTGREKFRLKKGLNNGDAHLLTTLNRHRSPMEDV